MYKTKTYRFDFEQDLIDAATDQWCNSLWAYVCASSGRHMVWNECSFI